jgi:hypothetical protein
MAASPKKQHGIFLIICFFLVSYFAFTTWMNQSIVLLDLITGGHMYPTADIPYHALQVLTYTIPLYFMWKWKKLAVYIYFAGGTSFFLFEASYVLLHPHSNYLNNDFLFF